MKNLIDKYINRIKVDYPEDDKLMIDLQDFAKEIEKQCAINGVGNLLKEKETHTFEDWMEEYCVKLGKYYQYKFEDILYTEEQLLQKYNTYKPTL